MRIRRYLRARQRALVWGGALIAALLLLGLVALGLGALALAPSRVAAATLGQGDPLARLVVLQWRLPRVAMAVVIGGALGVSGALFQSLVRNPLGSPDVIGFSAGAHSGALGAMILFAAGPATVALAAIGGGIATAALVYALAWRRGIEGLRLILIGVATSAMLAAFNHWLMVSGSLEATLGTAAWSAGSLAGMSWTKAGAPALFCCLGVAASLAQVRALRLLEMGDDVAAALGVAVGRTRLVLIGLGTALVAAATAATGPIPFIALAAPQVAQMLARSGGAVPLLAGMVGAVLLLAADLVAQHGFAPVSLPVGLVTLCIGGVYLVWLLVWQQRIAGA